MTGVRQLRVAVLIAVIAASCASDNARERRDRDREHATENEPSPGTEAADELIEDFEDFGPDERWDESSEHGRWRVRYEGFELIGTTREDGSIVQHQRPNTAKSAGETHATLVTSRDTYTDIDVTIRVKTIDQLREPKPNPWEVGWLLWRYTDNDQFYYLAAKPNGWGLGKADSRYPGEERFMDTGTKPTAAVGEWHTVRVLHVGNDIRAWINGEPVVHYVDREDPYDEGQVGLYGEDAEVVFDDVRAKVPEGSGA